MTNAKTDNGIVAKCDTEEINELPAGIRAALYNALAPWNVSWVLKQWKNKSAGWRTEEEATKSINHLDREQHRSSVMAGVVAPVDRTKSFNIERKKRELAG